MLGLRAERKPLVTDNIDHAARACRVRHPETGELCVYLKGRKTGYHTGRHCTRGGMYFGVALVPHTHPQPWRYESPGEHGPRNGTEIERALASAKTTADVLAVISQRMDAEYQARVDSRTEDGWFYGFADAMTVLEEVASAIGEGR